MLAYPNKLSASLSPLPAVVLLWGEDAGAIRQAAAVVAEATRVPLDDPFATCSFSLTDVASDPATLLDACLTMSFGASHKLVRLLPTGGDVPGASLTTLKDTVKALLESNTEGYTLVLPVPKSLEKRHGLVSLLEKHPRTLAVRFFADTARDLAGYLDTALQASGKTLTPSARQALLGGLGADREIAAREMEKLVLYAGDDAEITEDMVYASLAGATAGGAFRLADAVGSRDVALADTLIEQLLEEGEDLNQAFILTMRHLAKLHTLQTALASGVSPNDALYQLKPPPPKPAQAALLQQAGRYPAGRLAQLPKLTLDTLLQARSGTLSSASQLTFRRTLLSLAT
ncbi:MAG: DNA polymerase III subunit delta [Alphaproteobacteria bacterium CG_4_10_14_0_8_um_filter_53_9]|nr:MAG: DNA polymerase III subunit delta [Alphaproteobacteria bacterium CG_4_10_14_0_8_um_filter_53_9]